LNWFRGAAESSSGTTVALIEVLLSGQQLGGEGVDRTKNIDSSLSLYVSPTVVANSLFSPLTN